MCATEYEMENCEILTIGGIQTNGLQGWQKT